LVLLLTRAWLWAVADPPLFALDCEMVRTDNGKELARLSVVAASGAVLYDEFIKPAAPVRDYRAAFGYFASLF
jgi:hypothetical protein